jgi:hypothetical protein
MNSPPSFAYATTQIVRFAVRKTKIAQGSVRWDIAKQEKQNALDKPRKQMGVVKQEKEKSLQQTTYIQVTRTMHQSNRGRAQTVEPGRWAQGCTAAMDEVSRLGNTWKHLIIPT